MRRFPNHISAGPAVLHSIQMTRPFRSASSSRLGRADEAYHRAQRDRVSVPEVIRRALDRELRQEDREKK